jgi:hypothetical protein
MRSQIAQAGQYFGSMRSSMHIVFGLIFFYFSAPSEASCANFSRLGYVVNEIGDSNRCRDIGGAWVSDCCIPCASNSRAGGLIVVDTDFFPRMEEALSFTYSTPPKILQLLPGVYPLSGNCHSTVNYDSAQIIGVCGSSFTKIDCNQSAFHFKITGSNVTLQGLTLANGFSVENGGCITIIPPATGMTLVDSSLLNCMSYQSGGAISVGSPAAMQISPSVSISLIGNCRIENCSAKSNGGAIYITVASRYPLMNVLNVSCNSCCKN